MQHVSSIVSAGDRDSSNHWEYEGKKFYSDIETPLRQSKTRKNKGLYFWGCGNYLKGNVTFLNENLTPKMMQQVAQTQGRIIW